MEKNKRKPHPRGLYILGSAEIGERCSYYGMLAMMLFFLTEMLGLPAWVASLIYGVYITGVYVTPLPGGWLADKYVGYFRMARIGGCIMMVGHVLLGFTHPHFFIAGLGALMIGNGAFKPNLGALVRGLYASGDPRIQSAFSIYYMCVNIGALFAPFIAGYLRDNFGFHTAFASMGGVMFISLLILTFGRKYIERGDSQSSITAITGVKLPKEYNDDKEPKPTDKIRIMAIFRLIPIVILFWMPFSQNGSTSSLWARDNTTRAWLHQGEVESTMIENYEVHNYVDQKGKKKTEIKLTLSKMPSELRIDEKDDAKPSVAVAQTPHDTLDLSKVQRTEGNTLFLATRLHQNPTGWRAYPPSSFKEVSPEYGAGLNPAFIILLTCLLFIRRVALRFERIPLPTKIMAGMGFVAASCTVMALASLAGGNTGRVHAWWFTVSQFLVTNGELLISPMGLALVSVLAPRRMTALMMGVWYISTAIGNFMAGLIGVFWERWSHASFFWFLTATSLMAVVLMAWQAKHIQFAIDLVSPKKTRKPRHQLGGALLDEERVATLAQNMISRRQLKRLERARRTRALNKGGKSHWRKER